jgi:elongation factor Ts
MSNLDLIKKIRNITSLPFKDIQKAVDAVGIEDEEKIITYLREQGVLKQQSREGRATTQGGIFSYVHDGRIGVLLEIRCETDFVSRSDTFKELGNDLTLHIAAYRPRFISSDIVDQAFIDKEMEITRHQLLNEGKPEDKIEMILAGKRKKVIEENSLLSQPFLKNPDLTVQDLIAQAMQTTGENIKITRFEVFSLND